MIVAVRLVPAPSIRMFALGTKLVFEELPVTVRRKGAVSTSLTLNAIVRGTSSGVVTFPTLEMTGGSFDAATVTIKLRVLVGFSGCPSLAVTVMTALPVPLTAGVKRRVADGLELV